MGMPMRALKIPFMSCFAGKFLSPMIVPRGRLHKVANSVAVPDMWMLLRVMSRISDTVGYLTGKVLGGRSSILGDTRILQKRRSFLSIGLWLGLCFVLRAGLLG